MKKAVLVSLGCLITIGSFSYAQTNPDFNWEDEWLHHGEGGDSFESPTAVTDGNPQTATAAAASVSAAGVSIITTDTVVEDFSTAEPDTAEEQAAASTAGESGSGSPAPSLDVDVGYGSATVGGVDVDFYTIGIPYSRKLSPRASIKVTVPISFTNFNDVLRVDGTIGDARAYGGGVNLAYTYRPVIKVDGKPYRWKVTPSGGIFVRESSDLNQGSYVYNFGFSSSFAYRLSQNWIINMGNSISLSYNDGRKDYADPIRDNQQVLINALQLFYLDGRWTYYGYLMDTRFLKDALVDSFQTYALGVGFKLTKNRSLKATLIYEDGNEFESLRAIVGSSWKF